MILTIRVIDAHAICNDGCCKCRKKNIYIGIGMPGIISTRVILIAAVVVVVLVAVLVTVYMARRRPETFVTEYPTTVPGITTKIVGHNVEVEFIVDSKIFTGTIQRPVMRMTGYNLDVGTSVNVKIMKQDGTSPAYKVLSIEPKYPVFVTGTIVSINDTGEYKEDPAVTIKYAPPDDEKTRSMILNKSMVEKLSEMKAKVGEEIPLLLFCATNIDRHVDDDGNPKSPKSPSTISPGLCMGAIPFSFRGYG